MEIKAPQKLLLVWKRASLEDKFNLTLTIVLIAAISKQRLISQIICITEIKERIKGLVFRVIINKLRDRMISGNKCLVNSLCR